MPYATGRSFLDADSHVMELPGFLSEHADPDTRDLLPPIYFGTGGRMQDTLEHLEEKRAEREEIVRRLVDLGDGLIAGPKGYEALGAFDSDERTVALDLLGFERQFVFSTFSVGSFFPPKTDLEVQAACARAHNRAMAEFCGADERLIGVGAT